MVLRDFPPLEIVSHRVLWSTVVLLPLLVWRGTWGTFRQALTSPRQLGTHVLTAGLLAFNWLIYIWGTLNERILECSLGYFLTPLANVLLGRLVLKERLSRRLQWAVVLAVFGVGVQLFQLDEFPWVALALASTFSIYGLLRKQSQVGPMAGLALETMVLVPVALCYLFWLGFTKQSAAADAPVFQWGFLILTGIVTSTPLLLFATAARKLPMHTLGLLQYLAPMIQFVVGWLVYQEPLSTVRLISFVVIWIALILYGCELWRQAYQHGGEPSSK